MHAVHVQHTPHGCCGAQILDALSYCRQRKLCHRGVYPGNVLVDDADNIKLVGFEGATTVRKIKRLGLASFAGLASQSHCDTERASRAEFDRSNPVWLPGTRMHASSRGHRQRIHGHVGDRRYHLAPCTGQALVGIQLVASVRAPNSGRPPSL